MCRVKTRAPTDGRGSETFEGSRAARWRIDFIWLKADGKARRDMCECKYWLPAALCTWVANWPEAVDVMYRKA